MHNRITALGLSVKLWTSLPCRRPPSVRDLEGKQQNPPSIHVIPEVEHASARPLPFGGSAGTRGCHFSLHDERDEAYVALMRAAHSIRHHLSYLVEITELALARVRKLRRAITTAPANSAVPRRRKRETSENLVWRSGVRRVTIHGHLTI